MSVGDELILAQAILFLWHAETSYSRQGLTFLGESNEMTFASLQYKARLGVEPRVISPRLQCILLASPRPTPASRLALMAFRPRNLQLKIWEVASHVHRGENLSSQAMMAKLVQRSTAGQTPRERLSDIAGPEQAIMMLSG